MIENIYNDTILKAIVQNSYNSIVITDANLEDGPYFLYVNNAFTKLTGYTMEELEGKTPRILQGEETNQELLLELKKKLKNGEFFVGNTVNYKKDGSKYYVEWNITPIRDENNKLIQFLSMQKDITIDTLYKKELEQKVQSQLDEILQKDKLLAYQSKLASMGEMIDAIAHQWKQPINSIKVHIDILEYDFEDNLVDKLYVKTLQNKIFFQIEHMVSTLNEFRTFLRPNKEKSYFHLKNSLNGVLLLVNHEMLQYNINIETKDCGDFEIFGIENEFKHVIINILNNAKDAFISNEINNKQISIRTNSTSTQNQIYIEDNAGGIPKNIIDKIFESNFTTKKEQLGTGVGLYMSKQIISKMDGDIQVESFQNDTVFIITLNKVIENN